MFSEILSFRWLIFRPKPQSTQKNTEKHRTRFDHDLSDPLFISEARLDLDRVDLGFLEFAAVIDVE